jgi:hypothetical protein
MLQRAIAAWPFDLLDGLSLLGLLLLSYGCSLIHPALPWIVSGTLLIAYALLAARRGNV